MSVQPKTINIIGAGIGGLVLGIAAARLGMKVKVFEQAPVLDEVGAGITISPNASRVLEHLGLGARIDQLSFVPERQWTQHWASGEILVDKARGPDIARKYGAGYYHLHRADLHKILVEAFTDQADAELLLGYEMVSCQRDGTAIFADGSTANADILVGADGVKSVVRDCLFETAPASFAGEVAWRGLVPIERLSIDSKLRHPGIHVGPNRLIARYPVRNGELINYAAFVELSGWQNESWSTRSSIAELIGHFEGADPQLIALIEATPADQIFKWALHTREPLDSWIAGQVTLLGDAAHAMLPFMGQGAGTAIEDGLVLARALAQYSTADALRAYEATRLNRTSMVQLNSRLMGLTFQGKDPENFGSGPIRDEEALGLFDYDAVTIPV